MVARTSTRRGFLAAGVAGLLAGCSDGNGDGGATPTATTRETTTSTTPTATTTGTTTIPSGPTATLGEALDVGGRIVRPEREFAARHSLLTSGEGFGVAVAPEGSQYAFAGVAEVDGAPPPRGGFALQVGDSRFDPQLAFGGVVPDGFDLPGSYGYDPGRGLTSGWLGFEVPAPLPADGAVALDLTTGGETGRWTVPADRLETARAPPPSFELVGVEVPDAAAPGELFRMTVTLRNVGDGDGTALVAFAEFVDGEYVGSSATTVEVGAGGELSFTLTLGTLLNHPDAGEVRVALRTSGGDASTTVPVEGA